MEIKKPWELKVELFRQRFAGRDDVWSFTKEWIDKEGELHKQTMAAKGEGDAFMPVTDSVIRRHIDGDHQMIVHLLTEKGIRFGALDFDHALKKVSSEIKDPAEIALLESQYEEANAASAFVDAKLAYEFSLSFGLPCYIARSTKKGYHVYWFFDQWIDASLFTSFTRFLANKVGFNERALAGGIAAPEIFPKQTIWTKGKIGNGIRVPMTEPRMAKGRNCWVTPDRVPVEDQWGYFGDIKEVSVEQFKTILEEQQVEIINGGACRTDNPPDDRKPRTPGMAGSLGLRKEGDFRNVIESCPALKRFWEKDANGNYIWDLEHPDKGVPHTARVAMTAMAVNTSNGMDIIQERWNSGITQYQLEYANDSEQHPHTCRAIQAAGICRIGQHPRFDDHCLVKLPPKKLVDGKVVENPDGLPESEWPDPSPIRFASERHMPFETIVARVDELVAIPVKPDDLANRVELLVKAARYHEDKQCQFILDKILAGKLIGKRDLNKVVKDANRDKSNEEYQRKIASLPTFNWKGSSFFVRDGCYYRSRLDAKGNRCEDQITSFTVEITEEAEVISNDEAMGSRRGDGKERQIKDRWFTGYVICEGKKHFFKTKDADFVKGSEAFFQFLTKLCGTLLDYDRNDFDDIRKCIYFFSRKGDMRIRKRLEDFGFYRFEGVEHYITPSIIITKNGIVENAEYEMVFTGETSQLNMKAIDDVELRDLSRHILTDYFGCNSEIATMTAFGHAMAASIISHMPVNKSPILWVHGEFSGGKSFILHAAQCFFGNFPQSGGSGSSILSRMAASYEFRDAFMMVDDFKMATCPNVPAVLQFINNTYDRSVTYKLKRDGTPRDRSPYARGLVGFTSEDLIDREASAVSRLLPVEVLGKNAMKVEQGNRVKDHLKNYCGFTPHFIHYVYNLEKGDVVRVFSEYQAKYEAELKAEFPNENTTRVSENLSYNMTGFRLAMDMLLNKGILTDVEHADFIRRHTTNMNVCKQEVMGFIASAKGSAVFLEELSALIQDTAHFKILEWSGYTSEDLKNAKVIGHYKLSDPDHVYIYPGVVLGDLATAVNKKRGRMQTQTHIGKQLASDGHLKEDSWDKSEAGRASRTKQCTTPIGAGTRCWIIKRSSLNLGSPLTVVAAEEKPKDEGETLWTRNNNTQKP